MMMMNGPDKKEVARKLRRFGVQRFGTIKDFAAALGMNPVTLHSGYLNSRSLPGAGMLVKLMYLGCDLHWLLSPGEMSMGPAVSGALEHHHHSRAKG